MVSSNSSTDDTSSDSTSASESELKSESENGNPVLSSPPQKKPQPIRTSRNVAASVTQKPSNLAKRPRDEEQSRSLEKSKKAKEVKKTTPLETPKTSEKKPSEEKKMLKKSDSLSKSAKKNGHIWNPHDEIEFLKGVVAYELSKGLPKTNMTPVYDYIRSLKLLEHEYTSTQMYDKLRRLKIKFGGLKDKMNADDFTFKTPHDEAIFKLGKRLWGAGEEEVEESEDKKKGKGQDVEMTHKKNEEEEEDDEEEDDDEVVVREGDLASNVALKQVKQWNSKKKRKPSFVPDVVLNNGSTRGADNIFDLLKEKYLALMTDIKHDLAKDIKEMVREALRSSVSTGTSDYGEEMLKRISSSRQLPKLEKAKADNFEHKWKKQHFIELDATSKRLQLLQEECQLRMEMLGPLEENP